MRANIGNSNQKILSVERLVVNLVVVRLVVGTPSLLETKIKTETLHKIGHNFYIFYFTVLFYTSFERRDIQLSPHMRNSDQVKYRYSHLLF